MRDEERGAMCIPFPLERIRRRLGRPTSTGASSREAATVVLRGHETRLRFAADDGADAAPITPSTLP
ncbi:MAG TPA: hypothetical protein VFO94_06730 [Gammaproteobacteria bacterium]|nr:hypothetical protein [Gammaproteobacteria bacterium]